MPKRGKRVKRIKQFTFSFDMSKWDGTQTSTIAEDAVTASELQRWVEAREAEKCRYIVFPTTEHMMSWRMNVLGYQNRLFKEYRHAQGK